MATNGLSNAAIRGGDEMAKHPLLRQLLCVALVACLMLPLGRLIFPLVQDMMDSLQFATAEAVVSATLGFGLYTAMFG
jgi:hypothetical protein